METPPRIQTYEEFWPYYLAEHSHPMTKRLHVLGTCLGISTFTVFTIKGCWLTGIPAALVMAYGTAWYSHFFIQKNRPATFKYPLWSFYSDFRMCFLFLTGKLK